MLFTTCWSFEQNSLKSVNNEEKSNGPKFLPELLRNERRGFLYKCSSHNATSRRKNFIGKKLDVYSGLEIKAKDLSSEFYNKFTRNK